MFSESNQKLLFHDRLLKTCMEQLPIGGREEHLLEIATELCFSVSAATSRQDLESFANPELMPYSLAHHSERIIEFLSQVAGAFHGIAQVPEFSGDQWFWWSGTRFNSLLEKLPSERAEHIRECYGFVWEHASASDFLYGHGWPDKFKKNYIAPNLSDLAGVARDYLASVDFDSPVLEWSLVNAMAYLRLVDYVEVSGTAGFERSEQRMTGPFVEALPPYGLDSEAVQLTAKQAVLKFTSIILREMVLPIATIICIWLLVGFAIGHVKNDLATWIVVTGASATYFLTRSIQRGSSGVRAGYKQLNRLRKFIWDMSVAHDHVAYKAFHVGIVRNLLYRLEEQNAGFNPTIFHLLDKRERRPLNASTSAPKKIPIPQYG
jgi:hypothetical protein